MIIVHEKSRFQFANLLAEDLGITVLQIEVSRFNNGELKIETPVWTDFDDHVLFIFPEIRNINEQLLEFFLMLETCQHCEFIDVLIPYIPYSRQDESLMFQTVMGILKSLKVRKIITIDIHKVNPDKDIINIPPHELFGEKFQDKGFVVVAPDIGAIPRAKAFAKFLQTELVLIDKKTGKVENTTVAMGRKCLIVDDIVDSGKTIENATEILIAAGAKEVVCCVSDFARANIAEFHKCVSKKISEEFFLNNASLNDLNRTTIEEMYKNFNS